MRTKKLFCVLFISCFLLACSSMNRMKKGVTDFIPQSYVASQYNFNPIEASEPGGGAITKKERRTYMEDFVVLLFIAPALDKK